MSVIACVNPSFLDVGPSKNTLRFAEMLRVPVLVSKPQVFNAKNPSTWSNSQTKDWISKNVSLIKTDMVTTNEMIQSGTPQVDAEQLAPFHTGNQLVKMDEVEFVHRCKKTRGVTDQQASAFRALLWRMLVDSRKLAEEQVKDNGHSFGECSEVGNRQVPFKKRIKPGMVIRYKPTKPTMLKINLAMILCPTWALETEVTNFKGEVVDQRRRNDVRSYLCASVDPGLLAESYVVSPWRQIEVDVSRMEAEVLLEYDAATRFCFLGVS